jgi:Arylsulfotransferase (ASST)
MRWLRALYGPALILAYGFILYVAGFTTSLMRFYPYAPLSDGIVGAVTWAKWTWSYRSRYDTDSFLKPASAEVGVTRYDPERAFAGYTLFTSGHSDSAYLIDMQGNVVHKWHLPYEKVWNPHSAITTQPPLHSTFMSDAYLYPNGDLLAVYASPMEVPWGCGLVKMDRNSKLIWTNLDHAHHDVDVGPDGRIYVLTHRVRTDPLPGLPEIQTPTLEDYAVMLSADGKVLKKVSVYEAFARSNYRSAMLLADQWRKGDQIHTNAIRPITREIAAHFPASREGEVMLSFRSLDAIALLDFETGRITWFCRGPWVHAHDPEFLPDGHMLLFDNLGDFARGAHSRVIEFDPNSLRIAWQYPGPGDPDLFSTIRSNVQSLPNGNLLITEATGARMLEVTRDHKIVWEYRSPFRVGPNHDYTGVLCSGHRFAPTELTFDFNRRPSYAQTGRRSNGKSE